MAETFKVNGIKFSDGNTAEFIPPVPTESERGGLIAKDKASDYTVEVQKGSDGKMYVPTYPKAEVIDATLTKSGQSADAKVVGDKFKSQENDYTEKIKVNTQSIEALKREKAPAIIEALEGTNIVAQDSSNDPLRALTLMGYTEQEKTNGYQLFDASLLPTTSAGGATVTNNGDGSFTVSGSGSLSAPCISYIDLTHEETIKLLKAGDIHLNAEITYPYIYMALRNSSETIMEVSSSQETTKTATITEDMLSDGNAHLRIGIYSAINKSIVSGTIKPMLYQDGDGTWEPFTGGKASPNPDYPQELMDCGKWGNLLENTSESQTVNGLTFSINKDKSITVNGTATATTYFSVGTKDYELGKIYKVNGCPTGGSSGKYSVQANYYGDSGTETGAIDYGSGATYMPKQKTAAKVYIVIVSGNTVSNLVFRPQITYAEDDITSYRPYTGQKEVEVSVMSKNLVVFRNFSGKSNGIVGIADVDNGIASLSGTAASNTSFWIGTFTAACDMSIVLSGISGGSTSTHQLRLYNATGDTLLLTVNDGESGVYQVTAGATYRIYSFIYKGATLNAVTHKPMIRFASIADNTHVPYNRQQLIHTGALPGIPLGSTIPDTIKNSPEHMAGVWYREADGQYYIGDTVDYANCMHVKRISTVDVANSTIYTTSITRDDGKVYRVALATNAKYALWESRLQSNKGAAYMGKNEFYMEYSSSSQNITNVYFVSDAETTEEVLAELAAEASNLMYVRLTPITTDLPASELAAFADLHSNYPVTQVSNDCDANMIADYNADTKTWILNQINSVAASIVANL